MEGICVLNYDADRFRRSCKVKEYVELFKKRAGRYISTSSDTQLANVVMAVWAIYYNKPIQDDEAFVDSMSFCVDEDIEIINALVLMMNISPLNLELFSLTTAEAELYCEEYPPTELLHCKAVSKLYGVMKDSPKMRSGLKKLYKHISKNNDESLTLNIERFYEEA
tara:strand:+ start:1306 stop:1803 length:498 start_codon:yes stop_codon:yes gene_type:complete